MSLSSTFKKWAFPPDLVDPPGKKFYFNPLEDITPYELALVVRHSVTSAAFCYVPDETYSEWQAVKRHYTETEKREKGVAE